MSEKLPHLFPFDANLRRLLELCAKWINRIVDEYARKDTAEVVTATWGFDEPPEFFPTQGGGWRDMIGQAVNPTAGPSIPTWTQIGASAFYAYAYQVNDQQWFFFHIQHDYSPGTPIYLHVHWFPSGTDTATVKWQLTWTFAKGFNQGAASTYDIAGAVVTVEEAAPGTAYRHMVSEIATPISDEDFEVDGILMVNLKRITNGGTNNANTIFVTMTDCHYQSNTFNTKNRAPDFYA